MAKSLFPKEKFLERIQHQAVCTRCHFAGPKQDTESQAEMDAARHMSKPGNQNHIVKIITVQQRVRTFEGN